MTKTALIQLVILHAFPVTTEDNGFLPETKNMKKRFIAGVVCPKCGQQDSIMAYDDDADKVMIRECVACGFTDRISTIVNQPKEIQTRVTPESADSDDAVQVIKILK
ncbi:MAG: YheV family putative zinc ribbon protein [Reinekea sp.]